MNCQPTVGHSNTESDFAWGPGKGDAEPKAGAAAVNFEDSAETQAQPPDDPLTEAVELKEGAAAATPIPWPAAFPAAADHEPVEMVDAGSLGPGALAEEARTCPGDATVSALSGSLSSLDTPSSAQELDAISGDSTDESHAGSLGPDFFAEEASTAPCDAEALASSDPVSPLAADEAAADPDDVTEDIIAERRAGSVAAETASSKSCGAAAAAELELATAAVLALDAPIAYREADSIDTSRDLPAGPAWLEVPGPLLAALRLSSSSSEACEDGEDAAESAHSWNGADDASSAVVAATGAAQDAATTASAARDALAAAVQLAAEAAEDDESAPCDLDVPDASCSAPPVVIYTPRAGIRQQAPSVSGDDSCSEADDASSMAPSASPSESDTAGSAESNATSDSEGEREPRWRLEIYPRPAIEIPEETDTSGADDSEGAAESAAESADESNVSKHISSPCGATSSASTYVTGLTSPGTRSVSTVADTVDAAAGSSGGSPTGEQRSLASSGGTLPAALAESTRQCLAEKLGHAAAAAAAEVNATMSPRGAERPTAPPSGAEHCANSPEPRRQRPVLTLDGMTSPTGGLFGSRSHPYPQAALSPALASRVGAERAAAARASAAALAARSVRIGVAAARAVQEDLGDGLISPRAGKLTHQSVAGVRCRMSAAAAVRAAAEQTKASSGGASKFPVAVMPPPPSMNVVSVPLDS